MIKTVFDFKKVIKLNLTQQILPFSYLGGTGRSKQSHDTGTIQGIRIVNYYGGMYIYVKKYTCFNR